MAAPAPRTSVISFHASLTLDRCRRAQEPTAAYYSRRRRPSSRGALLVRATEGRLVAAITRAAPAHHGADHRHRSSWSRTEPRAVELLGRLSRVGWGRAYGIVAICEE